jgi:hypothetical protein
MFKEFLLFLVLGIFLVQFPVDTQAAEPSKESKQMNLYNSEEEKTSEKNSVVKELEKIQKAINKIYGNTDKFEEEGTLFFDEDGNAVFLMKKNKAKLAKAIELEQEVKNIVENNSKILIKESKYSTKDLVNLQKDVIKTLLEYDSTLIKGGKVDLSLSLTNQELVLKSREELPESLRFRLGSTFGEDLKFEITDNLIIFEPEKGRFDDWNNLGGGLAIKNQGVTGENCSSGPVARLGTKYFLLTAGHCLFPTGSMAYQFNATVGQDYATGNEIGYDVGLIHINSANTLNGGRLATNGILRSNFSASGYDDSFNRTADVYEGLKVCKSGFVTNTTCGVVLEKYDILTDERGNVNYITSVKGTGTDYSQGGDSGGITFSDNSVEVGSHAVLGTHVAGDDDATGTYGAFTRIVDTMRIYGVDIHVSSTPARVVY